MAHGQRESTLSSFGNGPVPKEQTLGEGKVTVWTRHQGKWVADKH